MADKDAKSLEERLKLVFDCGALCSLEQKKQELRISKSEGIGAFLNEDYATARQLFINGIPKTDSADEKEWLYKKLVECSKELFRVQMDNEEEEKAEEEFKKICAGYEHLIKAFETPENYLDYMTFLGEDMIDKYGQRMFQEAIRVGEIALCRFPEDYRIYDEMYKLSIFVGDNKFARDCLNNLVKLKFDDADYLLGEFGRSLWIGDEYDPKLPFAAILEYKGGAIYENPEAMHKYGKYMAEKVSNNEKLAVNLLYRAYTKKPTMSGLKEDLVEAFDNAIKVMKGKKVPAEEKLKFMRSYAGVLKIKKELMEAKGDDDEDDEASRAKSKEFSKDIVVVSPKEIKQYLDQFVIGQEQAKKGLSVGYYMHLLRLKHAGEKNSKMDKSNILLLGPTGCGKTYMLQILAQMSKVPLVIFDTSKITSAGYVGNDAEDCLKSLLSAANGDVKLAQRGIIYLDEADKIKSNEGYGKDVGGSGAQQQLLKLLEGSVVTVGGHNEKKFQIDTKNILFVVGGAFSYTEKAGSLGERIREREKVIGFRMYKDEEQPQSCKDSKGNIVAKLTDKDLNEYGFLPEFIGRLHYRIVLDQLTKPELRRILTEPGNAIIPQYENAFRLSGIRLHIQEDALDTIAEEAFKLNAGARSIKTICDMIFEEALFHLPGSNTKEYVVNREEVMRYIKK